MSDRQQQEDRINAQLQQRLQEKLASVKMIEGKLVLPDEPKKPESSEKEC
jgi:hypothetical protein